MQLAQTDPAPARLEHLRRTFYLMKQVGGEEMIRGGMTHVWVGFFFAIGCEREDGATFLLLS